MKIKEFGMFKIIFAAFMWLFLAFGSYGFVESEWAKKEGDVKEFVKKWVWNDSEISSLSTNIMMCTHTVDGLSYSCVYEVRDNLLNKVGVVKYAFNKAHKDWRPVSDYDRLKDLKIENVRLLYPEIIQTEGEYTFVYLSKGQGTDLSYLTDPKKILKACYAWGRALRQLHDQKIVHNDMHSSNLLFSFAEDGRVLIDFIDLDDFEYVEDPAELKKKLVIDLEKATSDILSAICYISGHEEDNKVFKKKFDDLQIKLMGSVKFTGNTYTEKYMKSILDESVLPILGILRSDLFFGFKMYEAFANGYTGGEPLVVEEKEAPKKKAVVAEKTWWDILKDAILSIF